MSKTEMIERCEARMFHVYNRFPVVFEHGEGVRLYDTDGKEYLDFASGIGVMALGYGDKEYEQALFSQMKKLMHTSNLYYSEPMAEASELICEVSGMDKVFFTNSGAEAVEGALKTAKKYGFTRDGKADHEIIAMNAAFHGRTVGSLSVTGTEHYRSPFKPLMDGVRFADFNDIESVKEQLTEKTIAVIVEPVQGEGGVCPADADFLKELRALCDEKGLLLIFDEIQCGMGRTGSFFAWQNVGIRPDILTTAKALGCGMPVGAFLVTDEVAEASLVPGDHGTTYGGNPPALAAVRTCVSLMKERDIPGHVKEMTPVLEETLNFFVKRFDGVSARRGAGFMQGLVLDPKVKAGDVVSQALSEGLVVLSAGGNVLRFLPPLVMDNDGIAEMEEKLSGVFTKIGL